MRYLLLSVLVIFAIGFFVVEDAFGIQYARVNIQHSTDTTDCGDDNSCYSPHTITIKQFEWVKWKNLDITTHTITAGYPHDPKDNVYDSGPMASGSTFEYQFDQKGKYPYFCQIHPWAQGFVIVTEGTSSTPPPTPPTQTQTTTSSKIPTILILDPPPSRIGTGDILTMSGILKSANGKQVVKDATIEIYIGSTSYAWESLPPSLLKTDNTGRFFDQSPPLDFSIGEDITVQYYAYYDGGRYFESSVSQTYRVLFTPDATKSTEIIPSTLPPGVKAIAPNFEWAVSYGVNALYDGVGNPKKDYSFLYIEHISVPNKKIIRGDGKDLLVFDLLIENTSDTPNEITRLSDMVWMIDGKDRIFSTVVSTTLVPFTGEVENPGFNWREDCPEYISSSINPGVIGKFKMCFEIPKNADHFKVGGENRSKYADRPGDDNLIAVFDRAWIGGGSENTGSSSDSGSENTGSSSGGGCLIATAAFGSEMAPQVQFLRELRDNTVLQTESGSAFMTGFNQFYYSFSPAVADYERENPTFKEAVKLTLTPLLTSLTLLHYADIDSESEMLGYGIGVILLNIGMYFVAPAILIMTVRKRI